MACDGTYTSYIGPLSNLPEDAALGLRFLVNYISAIDALDQNALDIGLDQLLEPNTTFTTNGGVPVPGKQIRHMFLKRADMLSDFSHTKFPVKAVDLVADGGRHTVICECTSM
jgi:hypothetical protein